VFFSLFSLAERFAHQQRPGSVREKFFLSVFFLPPAIFALFIFNLESSMDKWIIYFFHLPFFGVLAWWTLEKRIPAIVFWAYAALLAAGLAVCFRAEVAIGIIAGITLYCAGHSGGIHDWLPIRSLRYLGRISYSLFLIHYPSGWLVTNIGCRVTGDNPYAAVFWLALALVGSVGAAHLLYTFVEKPSFALAERLKSSATA
jgi:peptidoglycan/LPS O-acetylase OafA/YrhL